MDTNQSLPYVWDYDLTPEQFIAILKGEWTLGNLDQGWAATRLLEYAPYSEIRRLLGFPLLIQKWPVWRHRIRSKQRRESFDFLVEWLPQHHPELVQ
jgi:hypothetical protein